MKKELILFIASFALTTSVATAETVESGSKYSIDLFVFKGSSTCNLKEDDLSNSMKGIQASFKGTKGNVLDKLGSALTQVVNNVAKGSGCEQIGTGRILEAGESINAPIGSRIIAFKNPAHVDGKTVNPLPAVCTVQAGQKILLETRKSEGLRSIISIAGDGGLKCTYKK